MAYLSLVALHPLLRPSRAPLPPSIRADAVTTPPGSALLSTLPPPPPLHPFSLPLCSGLTTHSYLRSSPFDHRHPLAVLLFLPSRSSALSLSDSRRRSLSHSRSSTLDALSLSTQTYHGEGDPGCQPSRSLAPFRDSFPPCPSTGTSKGTIGRPG